MSERRVKELNAAVIDMEVLSYVNVTQWLKGNEAIAFAKEANDALAQNVKAFPDRFPRFATLPWNDPKAAAEELRRTINEYGFVGTLLSVRPQTANIYADDPMYNPIWEVLTEYDLPVLPLNILFFFS